MITKQVFVEKLSSSSLWLVLLVVLMIAMCAHPSSYIRCSCVVFPVILACMAVLHLVPFRTLCLRVYKGFYIPPNRIFIIELHSIMNMLIF